MKHNVWSSGHWVRCFVGFSALIVGLAGPARADNAAQAGGDVEELLGQLCEDLTGCEITAPADCLWKPFHDNAADCSLLVGPTFDAVDRRMCEMGLLLDGDLSVALGGGSCVFPDCGPGCPASIFNGGVAIGHIDRVTNPDEDPGPDGTGDSPFRPGLGGQPGDPSGFNVGCSVAWFVPDHDPMDGVDTSFLYFGWDIANFNPLTGVTPVQFDADGEGSACRSDRPFDAPEFGTEFYAVQVASCADLSAYDPTNRNTNGVFEFSSRDMLVRMNNPGSTTVWTQIEASRFIPALLPDPLAVTRSFPTADGNQNTNAGKNAGGEPCIDAELIACTGKCSGNGDPCSNVCSGDASRRCRRDEDCAVLGAGVCVDGPDCPVGQFCDYGDQLRNNVELVYKAVETSGLFGPHTGRVCNVSGQPCRRNLDCPGGETCTVAAPIAPDSEEARQNRFALAQLAALLRGDTDGDDAPEESAVVAKFTPLPDIEVSKLVRCADEGTSEFTEGPIDALIGSTVEYQIAIRNLGNTDLEVTVQDVLEAAGAQADFAACDVVCDFIEAELTSPRRGLADEPVNDINALGLGLAGAFFIPSCDPPVADVSFLESIQTNTSAVLGTLLGAELARDRVCSLTTSQACTIDGDCPAGQTCEPVGTCRFTEGDSIVIRFRAIMGTSNEEEFCDAFEPVDCVNSVSVTGTFVGESEVVAKDESGRCSITTSESCIIDGDCPIGETCELNLAGDNVATTNIVCRDIDFVKEVRSLTPSAGPFVTGVNSLNIQTIMPGDNYQIEYRYTVTNNGEITESVNIEDNQLCDDIAATNSSLPGGITLIDCPICPGGTVSGDVAPGGTLSSSCVIQFNSQDALRFFLLLDSGDSCDGEDPLTGPEAEDCYRNCASATAKTNDFGDICRPPADPIVRRSFTTICNKECELEVVKEVRCLEDCSPTGAVSEWVSDPSQLKVLPGACLQYRITTTNTSTEIPLCALRYTDTMSNPGNFAGVPYDVQLIGRTCTNLTFSTAFNVSGAPVVCELNNLLNPSESVTVLFRLDVDGPGQTLTPPNDVSNNTVVVAGAAEGDCPSAAAPLFSCDTMSNVAIDVDECDFEVIKEVTCDDPRDPNAVFEADDQAEALPGAEVGFRIQIENTGDVELTSVTIDDVLTCDTWYIPGSVIADIDGTPVTDCICTSPVGNCDQVTDVNGTKSFGDCGLPNGIPAGGTLTITFRVQVPGDFMTLDEKPDCTNTVTVQAASDLCQNPQIHPCPEREDSARINVRVPKIECDKQVCADLDNNGNCDAEYPFADDLTVPSQEADYPLTIIWKYTLTNTGEVDFTNGQICDPALIFDRNFNGLTSPNGCDLDPVTGCVDLGPIPVGGMGMATCSIQFNSQMDWISFAAKDGPPDNCYENEASGFAQIDTTDLCTDGADLFVTTEEPCSANVCIELPCDLEVIKEVRCLEQCSPTGPASDWVSDPSELMVTPGSCLQYRITVTNTGVTKNVDICALKFTDNMINADSFQSGPSNVQLIGRSCTNLVFSSAFNWNNNPVTCALNTPLLPTESVQVLFTGILRPDATLDPRNEINVMGAPHPTGCPVGEPPVFDPDRCNDDSGVSVDLKQCDHEVVKEVTCDDPRDPGAVFNDDIVDALPDSMAGFRMRITNTGEVNLTSIQISDVLTCSSWFVPGSVVADINGADVTSCLCPGGVCNNIGQLNGSKDLTPCKADGIAPGEVLTITFRVHVPATFATMGTAVDCTNTITVTPMTDTCSNPGVNPCPPRNDDARINVLVPRVACNKCVRLNDGPCQVGQNVEDPDFPLELTYEVTVSNTGETGLKDVTATDPVLVAPAVVPGMCDFVVGVADVGTISQGGAPVTVTCLLRFNDEAAFRSFAGCAEGEECCLRNTARVTAVPDEPNACESDIVVESQCNATFCIDAQLDCPYPCDCPPRTKVVFEIWNELETKFSGAERCIESWDQKLLSAFSDGDPPTACGQTPDHVSNFFLRSFLRTDKGKARIVGMASPAVCGPDTVDVPLLGVSKKILHFERPEGNTYERAGMALIGSGYQAGQVQYDVSVGPGPEEANQPRGARTQSKDDVSTPRDYDSRSTAPDSVIAGPAAIQSRASTTQKGSFFVFPKVEIKWNAAGDVIQDTFLDLTNDFPSGVRVQMFFVDGDCCTWLDNAVTLTQNQPIYWSALTGDGGVTSLSPFTVLGRGVRDPDPRNPGGRVLRGYVVGWAVNPVTNREINWNHLKGDAVIVNYAEKSAWEYNAWAFRALHGVAGQELLEPFGQLDFDGSEYEFAPSELLLDFYATGTIFRGGLGRQATIDTDLTLWAVLKDLRLNPQQAPTPP